MAKKSFKKSFKTEDNPALSFIAPNFESSNEDENIENKKTENVENEDSKEKKITENYTKPVDTVDNYPNKYHTDNNYDDEGVRKGPGRPPLEVETKTKRLNLLLLPSLFQDLEKVSTMKRTSVNNLINIVLKEYVEENKDLIDKYIEVFGE